MAGIHPDFAAFAADPRNTLRPPPAHILLAKVRAAADAAMTDPTPPPVAEIADATVSGDGGPVPVRLYRPVATGALPVIVFAHGGGFVWGSIATHDGICRRLALASGAAVVSVGYRLAPEAPFPAAMRDVLAVVQALPALAERWQIDQARLALCGDSAGGHVVLTAALALRGDARRPQALALIYPAIDPACDSDSQRRLADGPVLTQAGMRWFWGACLGAQADASPAGATPLTEDLSGLPPTLIVTAEQDPLQDEGTALASRLARYGVAVDCHHVAGAVHGFLSVAPDAAPSLACLSALGRFVTRAGQMSRP
jgi:acetyl esterase